MLDQSSTEVGVLALTNESNGCERSLLLVGATFADVSYKGVHQLWPLIPGQFYCGNSSDDLRRGLSSLRIGRGKGLKGELLDAGLRILVGLLKPFLLESRLPSEFSGCEGVLEGNTGGSTDVTLCVFICKLLDESGEI